MTLIKRKKSFEGDLQSETPANATEALLQTNFSLPAPEPSPQRTEVRQPERSYHNVKVEKPARRSGKLPTTAPWDKVSVVMSKEHNRKFREYVQSIRKAGSPDFNSRLAIEQALDLLFNVHNIQ